jgi:hypothetical protein
MRTQRFYNSRAYRDVRHKMPVHDIDMDPVTTSGIDRAHLFAQPGKIGG